MQADPTADPAELRIDLSDRLPTAVAPLLEGFAWRVMAALDEVAAELEPSAEMAEEGSSLLLRAPAGSRRSVSVEVDAPPSATATATVLDAFEVRLGEQGPSLRYDPMAAAREDGADWELSLAPGESMRLWVRWG